ncbi:DNA-deoxyinosine glycosylase [Polymorphobacter arshaanensis]|uniref:DNA-deoxyinosine glycosylase n=1 Tax=Glacieibacterium arshaanense TaxID=2511025 RepID=A0A4Y9EPM1_9SPHN|nr:DNA-deoxyinosine glycosylase [Polymorphobacter arshaanensis]TFU05556.1 DNA-deoxyinosine glycosylase [Polymorphobacter arshaanensis]
MTWSASFAPHVDPGTRLLIVGSLPGRESLARQQYYAHPRNQFWALVGAVIGVELAAMAYPDRLAALARHHIGLWDVVASASRVGSLDSAIRDHQPNDLAALAGSLPALRGVGFNGAAAFKLGAPAVAAAGIAVVALPSSSPAHAAMPLAAKRARWLQLAAWL